MDKRSLVSLYINYSLYNFAMAMTGIFVPIYLLRLGYGLGQVLLYFAVYAVAVFLFTIFSGVLSGRIGLKRSMILYFPLLFTFLGAIMALKYADIPLWLIAILGGSSLALYWTPLNMFLVASASAEKMGEDYGKFSAYPKAIGWIAPLLGGWIATAFAQGFLVLFAVAALIFLISLMPVLKMEDIFPKIRLQAEPFFDFFARYPRYILIETVHYVQIFSEQTIWPIFVFITFNSIFSIGVVGTALAIGSYFMMLFAGVGSDKGKRKNLLLWGALVMAVIWVLRAVTHDQLFFYVLTAAAGFFEALILVPFNSFSFSLAKKGIADEFIIFREFPVMAGRLLAILLAFVFMHNLQAMFALLAISQLAFLFF